MTHRACFPKSARLVSTLDFGRVAATRGPACLRGRRGIVSVTAVRSPGTGRVRVGLTVGKVNAPRSVDRALVKRVLRECARNRRESLADFCCDRKLNLDVVLRLCGPVRGVGRLVSVREAKRSVRESAEQCLALLRRRLAASEKTPWPPAS